LHWVARQSTPTIRPELRRISRRQPGAGSSAYGLDQPEPVERLADIVVLVDGRDAKNLEALEELACQELVSLPPRRNDRVERGPVGRCAASRTGDNRRAWA